MSYERKDRVNHRLEEDLRPARFARRSRPLSRALGGFGPNDGEINVRCFVFRIAWFHC